MGQELSIMSLPAQSGKTRKATELMNKWNGLIQTSECKNKHINIVLTSNNKVLVKQTAKRIEQEVDDAISDISDASEDMESDYTMNGIHQDVTTEGKTVVWISQNNKQINVPYLGMEILSGDIDNIIACTNQKRVGHLIELLEKLKKMHRLGLLNRTVNIWVDEADNCMTIWKKHIDKIHAFGSLINKCVLISASMLPVFKYFIKNNIQCNLRVYDETHGPDYVRFSDCMVSHKYSQRGDKQVDHVKNVLDNVVPIPGSIWFCPGSIAKTTHYSIEHELIERGFNVMILNGDRKELVFNQTNVVPLDMMEEMTEADVELSQAILKIYHEYQLYDKPFAVTGNLCIGRGITFATRNGSKEFMFTDAIIPDGSAEDLYQLVARLFGYIRDFEMFKVSPPKIYMTDIAMSKVVQQEHLAIELAKRYDNGHETTVLTHAKLDAVISEHPVKRNCAKQPKPQERIPLILSYGPEQTYLYSLTESSKLNTKKTFACLIEMIRNEPDYEKLFKFISHENTKHYATAPNTSVSIKKKITDVVNAAQNNNTYTVDINKKQKESGNSLCNVFVDKINKRLCVVIWSTNSELY